MKSTGANGNIAPPVRIDAGVRARHPDAVAIAEATLATVRRLQEQTAARLGGPAAADDAGYVLTSIDDGPTGVRSVRLNATYQGLDVVGGDIGVFTRGDELIAIASNQHGYAKPGDAEFGLAPIRLDTRAALAPAQAVAAAKAAFEGAPGKIASTRKVVYATLGTPTLAYEVGIGGLGPDGSVAHDLVFIDANDGRHLNTHGLIQAVAAKGVGNTVHRGRVELDTSKVAANSGGGVVYRLIDETRGNGYVVDYQGRQAAGERVAIGAPMTDADNVWGNGNDNDVASQASEVAYGVAKTWDYYRQQHGRLGIGGDGRGVPALVNVTTCGERSASGRYSFCGPNAFWSYLNGAMFYARPLADERGIAHPAIVMVDVAGHEMTHAITAAVNGLVYDGTDSGALNESMSDIFGTLVEFFADAAAANYTVGEHYYADGRPLRYMYKPSLDGGSMDCYPARGFAGVDPHRSSGVGNHFFYLLAEGTAIPAAHANGPNRLTVADLRCNGNLELAGIGRDRAGRIVYEASKRFASGAKYPDARRAMQDVAAELYGQNSLEQRAVTAAWDAVGVAAR